ESGDIVAGAKQPASYLFRFVPKDPGDLSRGRLQALQIRDEHGDPIAVDPATPLTPQIAQRYSYGHSLATKWLTVHDTATDGTAAVSVAARAAARGATPLKRPENGQFRPGTGFRQFFYTETGDTSATSTADTDV